MEPNKQRVNKFLNHTVEMALENARRGRGGPFAALVVKNGDIIATGTNTVTSDNDPTAHAEVVAIRRACEHLESFQIEGCDLYSSCEPCPMCLGAIYWARPRAVYFAASREDAAEGGFDDDFIYREIANPPGERKIPMVQVTTDKARDVFKIWNELPVKVRY